MSEDQNIKQQPADDESSPANPEGPSLQEEGKRPADEATQPPILNLQPQTSTMEVHHHGHVHEQKKWKEYVFQFFMLFLAVFCGFFAEYQLEHVIENNREKQYIRSMVQDLKTDTTKLGRNIRSFERRLKSQDTLLQMFYLIDKGFNQTFYRTLSSTKGFPDFIYTDGTIQQLKNSGGFRLIRKHRAVDSIMAYDGIVKTALINEELLGKRFFEFTNYESEIFDYMALDKKMREGATPEKLEEEKENFLFNSDKITISKYYNRVRNFNSLCNTVKNNMEGVKIKASGLINFLKKEYDLEDE